MIDKIVYTYWTNGGTDYKLGFLNTENMLHIFNKSIEQSKKLVSKVVVYCDKEGYDLLHGNIKADLILVDYSLYRFDTRYWNFPKIITYNMQDEPFLHIDIDAIVYKFDKEAAIVSEQKRGVAFDTGMYPASDRKQELLNHFTGWLTCSGVLGGNNIDVFKELFNEVKTTVPNEGGFKIGDKTRLVVEEVVLSSLIAKHNITVSYLGERNKDYIHFWGAEKQLNFIENVNI